MSPTASTPAHLLASAVRSADAAEAARLLAAHPELKSTLNQPLPDAPFGITPVMEAAAARSRELVVLLQEAGADINARSQWWAGSFGVLDSDSELTPFLMERGARVDAHAAARLGMLDRLQELVAADPGAIHARGGDGQMPLHFAATPEIAAWLLDHGADIDACDVDHESTAAQYMIRQRQDVVRLLVRRGCRTDILMAAALGDLELVRMHLAAYPASVRVNVSDEHFPMQNPHAGGSIYIWTLGKSKTAHVVAREFGHEEIYRFLMERSPNVLKLSVACAVGDEPMVQGLLAAQPNLVKELTADDLPKLADAARDNSARAVHLMLSAGWPVDVRGQHQATPLQWAAYHGNTVMLRDLLQHQPALNVKGDDFHSPPLGWAVYGSRHGWYRDHGDYPGTVEALLQAGANPIDPAGVPDHLAGLLRRYRR